MRKPFQIGERVVVFGPVWSLADEELVGGVNSVSPGELKENDGECVVVRSAKGNEYRAHVRQCRRLIKARSKKLWVNDGWLCDPSTGTDGAVRKKKPPKTNGGERWRKFLIEAAP